jgi:hypothetical protein
MWKNLSINFIDDNNNELTSENWNKLKEDTEIYLTNQKKYHDNNELLMNEEKTIIMINTKKKKERKNRNKIQ